MKSIMYLAMYKGKGRIGNYLIRWKTNSKYSHCELVIDGLCYSSSFMDKGVRAKLIELHPDNWDVIPLSWADAEKVINYYNATKDTPYGSLGIITSQILNISADTNGDFCSEWCAKALGIPNGRMYNPQELFDLCVFMNTMFKQ